MMTMPSGFAVGGTSVGSAVGGSAVGANVEMGAAVFPGGAVGGGVGVAVQPTANTSKQSKSAASRRRRKVLIRASKQMKFNGSGERA
jgi:hypothetical protein